MTRKSVNQHGTGSKWPIVIVAAVIVLGLAGFLVWNLLRGDSSDEYPNGMAKCGDVFQCLYKLDPTSTLEEMNDVVGRDAELAIEEDNLKIYKWALSEDTAIEARFATLDAGTDEATSITTINIDYPENLVPHLADSSKWKEIQSKMGDEDGVTYDQFVELLGGVSGTIQERGQGSKKYQWYSSDGHYLSANFDDETGKCNFATGDL